MSDNNKLDSKKESSRKASEEEKKSTTPTKIHKNPERLISHPEFHTEEKPTKRNEFPELERPLEKQESKM